MSYRPVGVGQHVVGIVVGLRRQARELIPAEDRVIAVPLVIDAAQRQMLGAFGPAVEERLAAVVDRLRQPGGERQRRG
jgi:hypothetical protein